MNRSEANMETSIKFWILLIPGIISFALFVLIYTLLPSHWEYPLSILIGLPICWKFGIRGSWASIAIFTLFLAIDSNSFPWQIDRKEIVLDIAMFLSTSLIFVIMAIAFDETKQDAEQKGVYLKKIDNLEIAIEKIRVEFNEAENNIKTTETLHQKEKEEFQILLNKNKDKILVFQKQERISHEELQISKADLINAQQKLYKQEQEILLLQAQNSELQKNSIKEVEKKEVEKEAPDFDKWTPEQTYDLWKSYRRSQGMYRQLREQFEEKSHELHKTRKALFHAEEQAAALQKTKEEAEYYDLNRSEEALHKYIIKLDQLLAEKEKERDSLEDSFHAIINRLINASFG